MCVVSPRCMNIILTCVHYQIADVRVLIAPVVSFDFQPRGSQHARQRGHLLLVVSTFVLGPAPEPPVTGVSGERRVRGVDLEKNREKSKTRSASIVFVVADCGVSRKTGGGTARGIGSALWTRLFFFLLLMDRLRGDDDVIDSIVNYSHRRNIVGCKN